MSFCERVTPQEYKEQSLITSQHSLKDLLNRIVEDENISVKERRKQLKQVCIVLFLITCNSMRIRNVPKLRRVTSLLQKQWWNRKGR